MMDVTVPLDGKKEACKSPDVVPLLALLLRDADNDVRANAAGALMMIAITTEGLSQFINFGFFPLLFNQWVPG